MSTMTPTTTPASAFPASSPTGTPLKKAPSDQQRGHRTHAAKPASTQAAVTIDRIRARAHEIFQARSANASDGDAVSDWVQAECELNGCSHNPSACSSVSHK